MAAADHATKTANGAPAVTAKGVMARMQANMERGGSLVVINAQSVGPRGKKAMTDTGAAGAAVTPGTTREQLVKMIDDAMAEGTAMGAAGEQAVDLWVLAFETGDIRNGKGERSLFVWFFLELATRFPLTAHAMLPLVPKFASWRTMNQLHMVGTADLRRVTAQVAAAHALPGQPPETEEQKRLRTLLFYIEEAYAKQLLEDSNILLANPPPGAALPPRPAAVLARAPQPPAATVEAVPVDTGAGAAQAAPSVSLAGKWAPTIGGSHDKASGLGKALALRMFPWTMGRPPTDGYASFQQMQYRKTLTALRAAANVVEVKMAGKRWREISPTAVPSGANRKYRRALLNKPLGSAGEGDAVRSDDPDRIACAETFMTAIQATIDGTAAPGARMKGSANQPHVLTGPYERRNSTPDPMLEAQWVDLRTSLAEKGDFLPGLCMVDVSGSMSGLPMSVSIALGILMSQLLPAPWTGRFLTFESVPQWHDISSCTTLCEAVQSTSRAPWGGSTNFASALKSVLEAAKAGDLDPSAMPRTLFVFSDMQFDAAFPSGSGLSQEEAVFTLAGEDVRRAFEDANYPVPHIVFWNLRASGAPSFQAEADTPGVSLMSGFSQQCMADFMAKGVLESGREVTPWETLNAKLTKEVFYPVRQAAAAVQEGVMAEYAFEPFENEE